MKVLLLGATGMIGQGVLRECLLDPGVSRVIAVVRRASGQHHHKLHEVIRADVTSIADLEPELASIDACFFCLGISSAGMSEERYSRVTYDITLALAQSLVRIQPGLTFIYISGASTDSTEKGRMMWARVKGRTENALLALPFKAVYMFRPGAIVPLHGIRSATAWYNVMYSALRPLFPIIKAVAPNMITTTEQVGRAMIAVGRLGYPKRILEMTDINAIKP